MSNEREVPEGFKLETVETAAGGHKYEVQVLQSTGEGLEPESREVASSLLAWFKVYEDEGKDPNEVISSILNAGNKQGASQGRKAEVLAAVKGDKDALPIEEAVEVHQKAARMFIQGAPRGGGGKRHESGLTAKDRAKLGDAMALEMAKTGSYPTKARMDEICKELGIDPKSLAA
jgi:hypothetical protein